MPVSARISSDQQAIIIGATNFVFTIRRHGPHRQDSAAKTLLLIGAAGCSVCLAGVAVIFAHSQPRQAMLLPLLVTFIAFFSISQGAVIWVYIGEIFPNAVRSKGQGIGSASHWFNATLIALLFPIVVDRMSPETPFIFFAIMTVVQFFVVLFVYPETKGQTLEALQRRLVKASKDRQPLKP